MWDRKTFPDVRANETVKDVKSKRICQRIEKKTNKEKAHEPICEKVKKKKKNRNEDNKWRKKNDKRNEKRERTKNQVILIWQMEENKARIEKIKKKK